VRNSYVGCDILILRSQDGRCCVEILGFDTFTIGDSASCLRTYILTDGHMERLRREGAEFVV
jgi:hypothetical protein